jgi:hypothetical protein
MSSHGFVTKVTFQNDTITFSVGVYGFDAGEPVEISGYATQANGAFANIYKIEQVPKMPDPGPATGPPADPSVDVTVEPQSGVPFIMGEEVTVIIRAAKVWVTVLGQKSSPDGLTLESPPPGGPITWDDVREVTGLNGDTGSPGPWGPQA